MEGVSWGDALNFLKSLILSHLDTKSPDPTWRKLGKGTEAHRAVLRQRLLWASV